MTRAMSIESTPSTPSVFLDADLRSTASNAARDTAAYGAFIVQRLQADAQSYRNAALFVPGIEEKEILNRLAGRKQSDIKLMRAQWTSASSDDSPQPPKMPVASPTQYWTDVDFRPIQSLSDALHFIYGREFRTMGVFERFRTLARQSFVEALFDSAVRRQRESILWLDTGAIPPPDVKNVGLNRQHRGVTWAVVVP